MDVKGPSCENYEFPYYKYDYLDINDQKTEKIYLL